MTKRERKHRHEGRETANESSRRHVQLNDRPSEYSISANIDDRSPLVRSQRRQKGSNSRAKRSTERAAYSYMPKDEFALLKERVVKPNCTRRSYGLTEELSLGRFNNDNKVADVNPLVIMDELELLEHDYVDKTGRRKVNKYPELDDIPETSNNSSCCKSVCYRVSGSKVRRVHRRRCPRQGKETFNGDKSVGRIVSKNNCIRCAMSPCAAIDCRLPIGSCAPRRKKNVLGSVVFIVGVEGERCGVLSYKVSEDSRSYTLVNVVDDCKAVTNKDEPQQKQEITLEFGGQRSFLIVKNIPLGKRHSCRES